MEPRKLTKEDIDKVRNIEGFPIGTDEDIIALSDAPYYTACPNPFLEEFIQENGTPYDEATDTYHREPFSADVSEGKNDPLYMAHSYHTKVPYRAIMKYILHYTNPGDIIFDGFCGSGMTGVAAQMCNNENEKIRFIPESKVTKNILWGSRNIILNDLSPAATFIARNYNNSIHSEKLYDSFKRILLLAKKELGWVYETKHSYENEMELPFYSLDSIGSINYVVWSDVLLCPNCGTELNLWDLTVNLNSGKISNEFICPICEAKLKKRTCNSSIDMSYDMDLDKTMQYSKKIPVLINYTYNGKRYNKKPDLEDLKKIEEIKRLDIKYWHPTDELPKGYNTEQPKKSNGIYYVHQLYTKRNLLVMSKIYSMLSNNEMRFVFTGILQNASKMYKFRTDGKGGIVTGTLFIPSLNQENNVFNLIENKLNSICRAGIEYSKNNSIVTTGSLTKQNIGDDCIDYIFTDPPFGANINYSELSFIWESWLKVITNNNTEAICNSIQSKGIAEYQSLMTQCFSEYFRVLKPNRWITVEFHNSLNVVWNAIQESIQRAGFIIADVRTLDKKQGSFKQVTTSSAVKQDLVISAYKPRESFKQNFINNAGTVETAWDFVKQHLANIPVVVVKNNSIEIISERQAYLLFDRMVAYHIMQGIPVPLDASDFYRGLDEKFLKRDGMYFLPDQVNEYDTVRIKTEVENVQMDLFVTNEKSAITWLYQQLSEAICGPQTYAELQPKFMQEVKTVDKYEALPELAVLLEENFLKDADDRWYIPDVTKEGDVAKLREKKLWKDFEGYMNSKGKLKSFRLEAIKVGFKRLWKDKNYQAIVDIGNRLPEKIVQEDSNILMYYDISLGRI